MVNLYILLAVGTCHIRSSLAAGPSLSQALLEDMLPTSHSQCSGSGTTFHSYNFTKGSSYWDPENIDFEDNAFLAEFGHIDDNPNRTWTMRVGKGGNIYSFVGAFGEAMPPQDHSLGPFIDEVWQMVAVDTAKNGVNGHPYFIHQAGTYQRDTDLVENPFFSPNLAKYCDERECSFVGWGQQAHVPTVYYSPVLYYTRFRDCGNGVVEATWLMHNFDQNFPYDSHSYFNVPWGGVRTSTLRDVLHANRNSGLDLIEPMPDWGVNTYLPNLVDIGGFTVFAQDLPREAVYSLPCGDGTGADVSCSYGTQVSLVIKQDNPCSESAGHTAGWGAYMARVLIDDTVAHHDRNFNEFFLTNQNGDVVYTEGLFRLANSGSSLMFFLDSKTTCDDVNAVFHQGDVITVSYADFSKSPEENLALSWVYGRDEEYYNDDFQSRPSRVRAGKAGTVSIRDYTVWTVNDFFTLTAGSTFYSRQYIIADNYEDIESHSRQWVGRTEKGKWFEGGQSGRVVNLFSWDDANFGASVTGGHTCSTIRCSGFTTPQRNTAPLFHVKCGDESYVGSDLYHFSPPVSSSSDYYRSYVCDGMDAEVRPSWTLLGYFLEGDCAFLQSANYMVEYCDVPSAQPTFDPTSSSPTSVPTIAAEGLSLFFRPAGKGVLKKSREMELQRRPQECRISDGYSYLNATIHGSRVTIQPSEISKRRQVDSKDYTVVSTSFPEAHATWDHVNIYIAKPFTYSDYVANGNSYGKWNKNLYDQTDYLSFTSALVLAELNNTGTWSAYDVAARMNAAAIQPSIVMPQITHIARMLHMTLNTIKFCSD